MSSLSIGSTRAEADTRRAAHRRVFAIALGLQFVIGALFLLVPTFSLGVVGLSALMGPQWPSIWGATLIFVTAMQVPGAIDPVNQRYANVVAVAGRALMVATFLWHGLAGEPAFLWFAAFDLAFGAAIYLGFRRLVIAELQTRP
jgi:hypothetical protein